MNLPKIHATKKIKVDVFFSKIFKNYDIFENIFRTIFENFWKLEFSEV